MVEEGAWQIQAASPLRTLILHGTRLAAAELVVIGGLEVTSRTEASSRVPILGALPGIGKLLGSTSTSDSTTRFFVFLRPSILRSRGLEELKYVSVADLRQASVDPGGSPRLEPLVMR